MTLQRTTPNGRGMGKRRSTWGELSVGWQAAWSCVALGQPCEACQSKDYCETFEKRCTKAFRFVLGFHIGAAATGMGLLFVLTAAANVGIETDTPNLRGSLAFTTAAAAVTLAALLGWLWQSGWLTVWRRVVVPALVRCAHGPPMPGSDCA